MLSGEYCNRDVVFVGDSDYVTKAAELMRDNHITHVVVIQSKFGKNIPVGIISDRDIVIDFIASQVDIHNTPIKNLLKSNIVVVDEHDDLMVTIKRMRMSGLGRVIVVNSNGELIGVLSIDEIIGVISESIMDLEQIMIRDRDSGYLNHTINA